MSYCDWCGDTLTDGRGNPRFEIFTGAGSKLAFVCRNGCPPSRVLARLLADRARHEMPAAVDLVALTGVA